MGVADGVPVLECEFPRAASSQVLPKGRQPLAYALLPENSDKVRCSLSLLLATRLHASGFSQTPPQGREDSS